MKRIQVAFLLLIGSALCQNDIPVDLQDIEKTLGDNIPILKNFNQSAVPSVEEVQEAIQKKCEKIGGINAYEKLEAAKDQLQECIESNFNFTQIQEELEEKRKTGSMEEVFAKYCLKVPIIQGCIKNLTDAAESCLEEEERANLKLVLNITDSLANFSCYKEGDRIAMFVAEGGFECLQNKKEGLENCANETFGHRLSSDMSLTNLPLFVIDDTACEDYSKFQTCTVKVLETCDDNTPANIVDALFKFIRRITPCKNYASSPLPGPLRRVRRSQNQDELNNLIKAYDQLKQKYEPHCLKNAGQAAANGFLSALTEVEKCQNVVQAIFTKKNQELGKFSFDYMCKEFRLGLRSCLANLTSAMELCSSPAESYLPKFGLEIYDSVFKYHCKDDEKALKKLLGEQDACMKRVLQSIEFCRSKTTHIRDFANEAVVTKSELCSDLKRLRNCFVDVGAQQCPNSANSNELIVGFTDAIYAPCSGTHMIVSFILIFVLLVLSKFL